MNAEERVKKIIDDIESLEEIRFVILDQIKQAEQAAFEEGQREMRDKLTEEICHGCRTKILG